jgi:hypothetical protein
MTHARRISSYALRAALALLLCGAIATGARMFYERLVQRGPDIPTQIVKRDKLMRVASAEGTLRAVQSSRLNPPDLADMLKIVWLADDGKHVAKGEVVIRFDESDFTGQLVEGRERRAVTGANIEKERIYGELSVKNRDRTAASASDAQQVAKRYQRQDTEIFSRHQIIESEIDQDLYSARVEHAKDAKAIQERLARGKLNLLGLDSKRAQTEIERAQRALKSLEVVAPHDGIFVLERNDSGQSVQLGDTVWKRQTVAQVSRVQDLEAEVHVLESDASGLEVGKPAIVRLESDGSSEFAAEVRQVSTLAKQRHPRVPAQYFDVKLRLLKLDADKMKPGKRVRATLTLGAEEGLVISRQAVFERDGRSVVFRLQGGRFDPVRVKLGGSSPGRVVVTEGLREGDEIALHDPQAAFSSASASASNAPPVPHPSSSSR